MNRAISKTLENRLKEKVGQTVQSLDIISQVFIVVLVTGLKTLTNFDAVKWLQVTKLPVKYYPTIITGIVTRQCKNLFLGLPEVMFFLVDCNCTIESYYKKSIYIKIVKFYLRRT